MKMASKLIDLISKKTNCTYSTLFLLISKKLIYTCSTLFFLSLAVVFARLQRCRVMVYTYRIQFGLIVPIHNKADRSKVENYRGITLLSALGKLVTSILNNRLYDYMAQKGILKAEQSGFRKMHGTVDTILTLKTLIDQCVKSKPQKHRNLLFSCFVDKVSHFYFYFLSKN